MSVDVGIRAAPYQRWCETLSLALPAGYEARAWTETILGMAFKVQVLVERLADGAEQTVTAIVDAPVILARASIYEARLRARAEIERQVREAAA